MAAESPVIFFDFVILLSGVEVVGIKAIKNPRNFNSGGSESNLELMQNHNIKNPPDPDQLFGPKQGVPLKLCIAKIILFSSAIE